MKLRQHFPTSYESLWRVNHALGDFSAIAFSSVGLKK